MKIRFQADNDLDQRIVVARRRLDPTIDFHTAHALKLHGVPDTLVLKRTAAAERILVSHDRHTLAGFFKEFISTEKAPGLIIIGRNWLLEERRNYFICCGLQVRPRST